MENKIEWVPSSNGNPTTTYKGFRATCFKSYTNPTAYIYLDNRHIGRLPMAANTAGLEDFKKVVDEYYNGIFRSYYGNREYFVTGTPIVSWFTNGNTSTLEVYGTDGKSLGKPEIGKSYIRGNLVIELLSYEQWSSLSGKTTWTDSEYKIFKDGEQYKPKSSNRNTPIDPDIKPGILGYFQSFTETPRGLLVKVATREEDEWEVLMTMKIPGYNNTKTKLEQLEKGTLIETTVSNHNYKWGGNEYFNGFKVLNTKDLYVKPIEKDEFYF